MGKNNKAKINFRYNLKTYFEFLMKYKWLAIFIILFTIFTESKNVFDKFLFKIVIDKGTEFTSSILAKAEFVNILMIIGSVFISLTLLQAISNWIKNHLINKLETKMIADLKRKYFSHILNLDHSFHVTHKTGSLISRLTRAASATERLTDIFMFNFASLIVQTTAIFFTLIYLDFISAIILIIIVATFLVFSFIIQKIQEESNLLANKTEDIEKGNVADFFTNVDSIKYFGKEKIIKEKYQNLSEETKKAYLKNWNYFRYLAAGQTLILASGTFFMIYSSLLKFLNNEITIGTLAFIYTVYLSLVGYMFGFVDGIRGFYRSMADFQDLFEYGKIQKDIKDNPNAKELKIKEGEIEFRNLKFNYGKRKIFNNFSLKILKNKKIALVGHSGSGKTTLVKLLYRFYDLDYGQILIDNVDIKDVKQESLREEMSIVPQECILFDDTVYNNIKFSNPKAIREEVMQAIKFAQLDKIIEKFPNKEKTIVGERGVRLSGGEKQRVSIARAILANKKILVLDEATSSLDSETEHEIQNDLEKLMQNRTSIIIAHRLSTIMKADKIIVMKNGKIVQEGAHAQLINRIGEYKHLWNLQRGGYIK
ncbi:ABC transporter ATP-binding protein [Candidatus Pacearchaeota archaeon]|nr:ABC transporter ATP-binding protein [Candidatus Pacearchaeota archaeon]